MTKLLLVEGTDCVGKTTFIRGLVGQVPGLRSHWYGPPPASARSWRDAWGIDIAWDSANGHDAVHDRGILGHMIWHGLIPEKNERLLVPPHDLGNILWEVMTSVDLRVLFLTRSRRAVDDCLAARGEATQRRTVHGAVASYGSLQRTLTDLGVPTATLDSSIALHDPKRTWDFLWHI